MTALEACHRAYHAWVRTQPQLILDLWGDELEQADGAGTPVLPVGLFEPVGSPENLPAGGLDSCGTEPRHAPHRADGYRPRVSGHPSLPRLRVAVGAAYSTTTEAGANHFPVTRARLQKGL